MKIKIDLSFGNVPSPKSKQFWLRILIMTIAISVAAYILPGIVVKSFPYAILTAIIISLFNFWLRPILVALTLPFLIMTIGVFYVFINAAIIELTAWILPGFDVSGFGYAILFSLIVSFLTWIMEAAEKLYRIKKIIRHNTPDNDEDDQNFTDYEDLTEDR